MTIKQGEDPFEKATAPKTKTSPQDRYRRGAGRRDLPTAEIYTHPRYVPQLRQMIKQKMEEFRTARTEALDAIDERIHEMAHLKHEMDPAVATELMVTLAEARSILLSLNPTATESERTLAKVSNRLKTFVKQQKSNEN